LKAKYAKDMVDPEFLKKQATTIEKLNKKIGELEFAIFKQD
jgi:hypothetical protein